MTMTEPGAHRVADQTAAPEMPLDGLRFGVTGKGGAGKSTTTVLLARELRRRGYEIDVLDADSTNVGIHRALGIGEPPDPLLDYFGGMVFSGGSVTCPVDDPTPLPGADVDLDELPRHYWALSRDGIRLLTAGKLGGFGPGAGCDGPINKIARDFSLHSSGREAVSLVDFKAGFEDASRGAIVHLDYCLVVVDPTTAAIQMAAHMQQLVEGIRSGSPPATAHLGDPALVELAKQQFEDARIQRVLVVLNRVRDDTMARSMAARLSAHGIEPLGSIRDDPTIADEWFAGESLESDGVKADVERLVDRMEDVPVRGH